MRRTQGTIGSLWALSASVLAILGLSGVLSVYMFPVAAIALWAAFLMLGAVGMVWARMVRFAEYEASADRGVFFTGAAAVLIAGITGIVLGILSLVFLAAGQLAAVAVIVLGAGLLLHSGAMRRVSRFTYQRVEGRRPSGPIAMNALSLAPVRDFLWGLGTVTLGILAILSIAPTVLGLVALLALGVGVTLTVSTICGATLATVTGVCSKG